MKKIVIIPVKNKEPEVGSIIRCISPIFEFEKGDISINDNPNLKLKDSFGNLASWEVVELYYVDTEAEIKNDDINFFTYDELNNKILHIDKIIPSHSKEYNFSFLTKQGTHSGIKNPKIISTTDKSLGLPLFKLNFPEWFTEQYQKLKEEEHFLLFNGRVCHDACGDKACVKTIECLKRVPFGILQNLS